LIFSTNTLTPQLRSHEFFRGRNGVEEERDMERLELESFEGRRASDDARVDGEAHFGLC